MMDWMAYFSDFFRERSDKLEKLFDAAGCREGWVQGEMFLDASDLGLKTNSTNFKYDLLCEDPPMIGEIKISGGDYSPKMRAYINHDVEKLAKAQGDWQRFMILIVDNRKSDTSLGRWLFTCDFDHVQKNELELTSALCVRMWEIRDYTAD